MQTKKSKVVSESIVTFMFFLAIGLVLWRTQGHIFYLYNFGYIGFAAAFGELIFGILPREKKVWGRKICQFLIGFYMLGVLGFLGRENMQIEGFFFYLLAGVFSGPVLHYLIAKIGGTILFGRGWCGWACWTTMILDFLPWMKPASGRLRRWGALRYIHFFSVIGLISVLWFFFDIKDFSKNTVVELSWLIIGNLAYYAITILLAAILKDNRAFCKYVCPIPVVMKIGSRFSIWKIRIDKESCTECEICEQNCPMDIKLLNYMRINQRVSSTECIACQQCVNVCPTNAINYSKGYDMGRIEFLNYK